MRKAELIGWPAELDRAAEEAFKLRRLRVVRKGERHPHWPKVAAGHFPQTLDEGGDREFGVLPGEMSGQANELGLSDRTLRRSNESQARGFVGNAAIARRQRQRVADVVGG